MHALKAPPQGRGWHSPSPFLLCKLQIIYIFCFDFFYYYLKISAMRMILFALRYINLARGVCIDDKYSCMAGGLVEYIEYAAQFLELLITSCHQLKKLVAFY
jgi:hypothetical protein